MKIKRRTCSCSCHWTDGSGGGGSQSVQADESGHNPAYGTYSYSASYASTLTWPASLWPSEPYTPTKAPMVPMRIKRWNGLASQARHKLDAPKGKIAARNVVSATNQVKARLHQTEPPNALPASWRCPGSPRVLHEALSLATPRSHSVMAATIPAMSTQRVTPSARPQHGIELAASSILTKHSNGSGTINVD